MRITPESEAKLLAWFRVSGFGQDLGGWVQGLGFPGSGLGIFGFRIYVVRLGVRVEGVHLWRLNTMSAPRLGKSA